MNMQEHCKSNQQQHHPRFPRYSKGPEGEPVVLLPLTRGLTAMIDREVWGWVAEQFGEHWVALSNGQGRFYARASRANDPHYPGDPALLHRVILEARPGGRVTFNNGDSLDCRRANLRLETAAETERRKPAQRKTRRAPKERSAQA
ncbi:hypothetical protein [Halorhodospira neutriphila]|uniref:HNH nuclease domain-containing protein n=1 Tax=Halorhodospira neutriphila TaxID=168379 RepID=A0ABS1E4G0_9GAMM|nr:hypothetical protein [Halorhodospira neutriphila]MBK1726365.1 hypothetical protein [Halorhodospira neutriphila]